MTHIDKEDNLYEMLELESPYVSHHQIDVGYEAVKKKYDPKVDPDHAERYDMISRAHKCLKRQRCRD